MKDCAHCLIGNTYDRTYEETDPTSGFYWHCDCWGGIDSRGVAMDCCRCEKVFDTNCTCDECVKRKAA